MFGMYHILMTIFILLQTNSVNLINAENEDVVKINLNAPNVHPDESDSYICTSMELPDEDYYIVGYEPHSHKEVVHHMLLYGCDRPGNDEKSWKCGEMGSEICEDSSSILYGWAKDAPSLHLPKGVGFKVGGRSNVKYLVMQLHYVHALSDGEYDSSGLTMYVTKTRQPHIANIYLILAMSAVILPNTKGKHVDMACQYDSDDEIHAFAFRTHAHDLGRVISGYRYRNNSWTLLGKGDPSAAQAFFPTENITTIKKGDILAARCTFDGGKNAVTGIGATANDEMCNFYIMYYQDAGTRGMTTQYCDDQFTYRELFRIFPNDSDVALKSTEHHHHHHSHHIHNKNSSSTMGDQMGTTKPTLNTAVSFERSPYTSEHVPSNTPSTNSDITGDATIHNIKYDRDEITNTHHGDKITMGRTYTEKSNLMEPHVKRTHTTHHNGIGNSKKTTDPTTSTSVSEQTTSLSETTKEPTTSEYTTTKTSTQTPVETTPQGMQQTDDVSIVTNKLGQVTGLAMNSAGQLLVFHRSNRVWDSNTFNEDNTFRDPKLRGAIQESTIVAMDVTTGKHVGEWGHGLFYLPHGLTVDHDDNIWVTDVARHQVMKLDHKLSYKPSLMLGRKLVPGSDDEHFCKPTDIAVEESGVFYVSDGYCNGRIMKFSPTGALLQKWGKLSPLNVAPAPLGTFNIPHSLTLDRKRNMLYVADRENGRIQCFDTEGKFHKQISSKMFGGHVFAVDYNNQDDVLYAVNGPSGIKVQGFTIEPRSGKIMHTWGPHTGFSQPHAIVSNGTLIFVGEIGPNIVWKIKNHKAADGIKEENFARGLNKAEKLGTTKSSGSHGSQLASQTKAGNRPAFIILGILAIPAVILLIVGIVNKVRGKNRSPKYNMMDDGLGNPSLSQDWCTSVNCCRRPYSNMEELYLMDSDSDMEIYPDVHINK